MSLCIWIMHVACPAERTEVVSTFRSDGRWSPHTTRSWEFVGLEEGLRGLDGKGWLPSGAHAGENVIVGMLDSGEKALLNTTTDLRASGQ